jgi:hypothetical protein
MDYKQLEILVKEAVNNAIHFDWWLYLLIFLIAGAGAFMGSYLKKKAENIATKEDIEEITKKIEDIRAQYMAELESHKASLQLSNQLKLAALDKRLQKHQEAYTLWRKLLFNLRNEEKIGPAINECQRFWEENCLYLSAEARSAFQQAIFLANDFRTLPGADPKEIREWHKAIKAAGDRILEAVNLPSLGEDETKPIKIDEKL